MDCKELLEEGLRTDPQFSNESIENLVMIGEFIGKNPIFFKKLYKAYRNSEKQVEYKAKIGAPVCIIFDRSADEVKINRASVEIELTMTSFLRFLEFIDTCFLEIVPLGSVVDIDLDFASEKIRKMMKEGNQGTLVMISAQKVSLEREMSQFVIDYIGRFWPFGEAGAVPPIYLSNAMIKNIVHKGLTNEFEQEVTSRLRKEIIQHQKRSLLFLSKGEADKIMKEGYE